MYFSALLSGVHATLKILLFYYERRHLFGETILTWPNVPYKVFSTTLLFCDIITPNKKEHVKKVFLLTIHTLRFVDFTCQQADESNKFILSASQMFLHVLSMAAKVA